MSVFEVQYKGLWMGGCAIVIAETEQEAIRLVREHESTVDFTGVSCTPLGPVRQMVAYNRNGDY